MNGFKFLPNVFIATQFVNLILIVLFASIREPKIKSYYDHQDHEAILPIWKTVTVTISAIMLIAIGVYGAYQRNSLIMQVYLLIGTILIVILSIYGITILTILLIISTSASLIVALIVVISFRIHEYEPNEADSDA